MGGQGKGGQGHIQPLGQGRAPVSARLHQPFLQLLGQWPMDAEPLHQLPRHVPRVRRRPAVARNEQLAAPFVGFLHHPVRLRDLIGDGC